MSELSSKIIGKIEKERLKPLPRWHFLLKNRVLWVAFALSVFLGGVSVCMSLESLSRHWGIYAHLKGSFLGFLLIAFPYLWVSLLLLMAALAYYEWKNTRGAYRAKAQLVLGASMAGAVVLGITGHVLGWGYNFNKVMRHAMPSYGDLYEKKELEVWNRPQEGTLSGQVKQVTAEDFLVVEDPNGRTWQVSCPSCGEKIKKEDSYGRRVKMIGEREKEGRFVASELRQWEDEEDEEEEEEFAEKKKKKSDPKESEEKEDRGEGEEKREED
ncbi:MAG TPA: hypothetical protein PKA31_03165 [Candidatus Moranbacteria bacterium]|nr:hypothetical protein [Candidatus Moranbacteria bacterium]